MKRLRVLPRTEFGDPILERRAARVAKRYLATDECRELIRDMVHTMRRTQGVGLAAPQVGIPLRIAVMEVRSTPERPDPGHHALQVIVNPKIVEYQGTPVAKWEGCLSFQKIFGQVPRYERVVVEYQDQDGMLRTEHASGLWAHIFQHEIDHLDGIRYIDRLEDPSTLVTRDAFRRRMRAKRSR